MKALWLSLSVAAILSVFTFWPALTAADKTGQADAAVVKQLRAEVDQLKRDIKALQNQDDKGGGAIAKLQAQVKALEEASGEVAVAKLLAELDRQNRRFVNLELDFVALQRWSVSLNEWLSVHVK